MRKLAVIIVTILLLGIICLQILAALNIFPREQRVPVCPVDAISMQGGKARIDPKKCIGCRRCVAGICPEIIRDTVFVTPASYSKQEQEKPGIAQDKPPTKSAELGSSNSQEPGDLKIDANSTPQDTWKALYQVKSGKCVGCGLCTIYCPTGAISMVDDKAVIDPDKCDNCGICKTGNEQDFKGCPFKAISGP